MIAACIDGEHSETITMSLSQQTEEETNEMKGKESESHDARVSDVR